MNFFKKALVATAVVASFGASAAIVAPSTTSIEVSKEGVAAGVAAVLGDFDFNVTTEAHTPADSVITITFGENVDLAAVVATNAVDNTTTPGTGDAGDVVFDYGNGSFTFDDVEVDTTTDGAHFLTFKVSLGQPIASGAAFNVAFVNSHTLIEGASVASYAASNGTTDFDTGSGEIAKEVTQFTFKVSEKLDGVIDRDTTTQFLDGTFADVVEYTVTDNAALALKVTATAYTANISGNFENLIVTDFAGAGVTPTVVTAEEEVALALTLGDLIGGDNVLATTITNQGVLDIPVTGTTYTEYVISSADFTSGELVLEAKADSGEWLVDATIINVPYFPVGIEGVQSQINLSNETSSDVDVLVTAIDQNGMVYDEVNLNTLAGFEDGLPADTVSKLGEGMIQTLLGAADGVKLSVTFNLDAEEGEVNGYAFTQKEGTGRTEISTSQQRGN